MRQSSTHLVQLLVGVDNLVALGEDLKYSIAGREIVHYFDSAARTGPKTNCIDYQGS